MRFLLTLVALLASCTALQAQTVIITPPGGAPVEVSCATPPGCTIQIPPTIVVEPTPPCAFVVAPQSLTYVAAGGDQTVAVQPSRSDCTWGTSGAPAWLTLTQVANSLRVSAAANTAAASRTATLTVAGIQVVVTQAGATPPTGGTAPGQTITELDCTVNFPNCNWGYWGANQFHTFAAAGKGFRITLRPDNDMNLSQFYAGVGKDFPAVMTERIYITWEMTVHSPFNSQGAGDSWSDKFIMLNDPDAANRLIAVLKSNLSDTDLWLRVRHNTSDIDRGAPDVRIPIDQRVKFQIEVRRGAQARIAIWMNNQNYNAPTSVGQNFNWPIPTGWRNVRAGFYQNAAISTNGHVDYTVHNLRVSDTFNPTF